jgi:hypothetical protein
MVCLGDASPGVEANPSDGTDGTDGAGGTEWADGAAGTAQSGDPTRNEGDGCGRTFYLNFVRFEDGREVEPAGGWLEDEPSFDFLR